MSLVDAGGCAGAFTDDDGGARIHWRAPAGVSHCEHCGRLVVRSSGRWWNALLDRAPAARRAVVVDLEEIATGARSVHVIRSGETLMVTVNGYITMDGKRRAVVEFPVRIRAHAA